MSSGGVLSIFYLCEPLRGSISFDCPATDPHFADGETEETCPCLHSRSGALMRLECHLWPASPVAHPALSLSCLSVPLRGRESHARDSSRRSPVRTLRQEHNYHLGQQAHLRPARGDPHPPQRYCAAGGTPGRREGEVRAPPVVSQGRVGVRGRGEASLLGKLAQGGGVECLLSRF